MNIVFPLMIIASVIYAAFSGTLPEAAKAAEDAAKGSAELMMSFMGVMCMWAGVLRAAERGGAINFLSKLLFPVPSRLFPKASGSERAMSHISSNIAANIIGAGNAATPAGIAAMEELDGLNCHKLSPSDEMCIFALINTASIQLVPSTVIALRRGTGSANASGIIPAVWISSAVALCSALAAMKLILFLRKRTAVRSK